MKLSASRLEIPLADVHSMVAHSTCLWRMLPIYMWAIALITAATEPEGDAICARWSRSTSAALSGGAGRERAPAYRVRRGQSGGGEASSCER
jgi:hypothetical protein